MTKKEWALLMVAYNWRLRRRLRRITSMAARLGLLEKEWDDE